MRHRITTTLATLAVTGSLAAGGAAIANAATSPSRHVDHVDDPHDHPDRAGQGPDRHRAGQGAKRHRTERQSPKRQELPQHVARAGPASERLRALGGAGRANAALPQRGRVRAIPLDRAAQAVLEPHGRLPAG